MPDAVATNIIVFGRGLVAADIGFQLTRASAERVDALVAYVEQNSEVFSSRHGKIVFSGGWAGAAEGVERPPARFREGALMLGRAKAANIGGETLARYAETYSEIDSDSTLENVLRTKEACYFNDISFTVYNPLGLIAHHGHMARIDYLIRKAFGVPRDAIVHIVASGADNLSGGFSENIILAVTCLAFLGANGDKALRRRHRILVGLRKRFWSRNTRSKV